MRYSIELKDRLFLKGYRFLYFAKNIGKHIGKNVNGKYSQKRPDYSKQPARGTLKTASKKKSNS